MYEKEELRTRRVITCTQETEEKQEEEGDKEGKEQYEKTIGKRGK